jgi:hypothetical protein
MGLKNESVQGKSEYLTQGLLPMNGLTNYITEWNWTDIITTWYVLIDDEYQSVTEQSRHKIRSRGPAPLMSDSEVITVGLIIETFFQGHEEVGYAFVSQYLTDLFPYVLDLDRFNVRRRSLIAPMEAIRRNLRDQKLDSEDPVRLVDSAPVTLMTYTRGKRSQSAIGSEYFGVVTSKKAKFFGLRLHATVTVNQMIDNWMLAPASVHDVKALDTLVLDARDLVLIGDKAYNDEELEARLWHKRRIQLLPLRRQNQKKQWSEPIRKIMGRIRHHVETVFSTLTTTFNIQRPRGRSLQGHVVRITSCVLAHTLSFFMVS